MDNIYISEYIALLFDLHELGWSASEKFEKAYIHKLHRYIIAEKAGKLYLLHEAEDDFYTDVSIPINSLILLIAIDESYNVSISRISKRI